MKNIFSQLGTKKVAGVVLAGATLMVGLGVVNNFSGNNQKATNEAALANFSNSAYNNFVGSNSSNRTDIERQISAAQDVHSARFLTGKSDGTDYTDAFSSDGAYAEGVRSDNIGYGSANGIYQPFDSTYEQDVGGKEFNYNNSGSGYGKGQFQETQNAAAAKVSKDKADKNNKSTNGKSSSAVVNPKTKINKLATSNGSSTFGSGKSSGTRSGDSGFFGPGGTTGSNDNNTRALPQAGTGQEGGQSFKLGRTSGMGNANVNFKGNEVRSGRSQGTGAASDLQVAVAYSAKALSSNQDASSKSFAEAAFDGSNPEGITPTIPEGASIDKVANALLDTGNISNLPDDLKDAMNDVRNTITDTLQKAEELAALQKKLTTLQWATAIGALVLSILIAIIKNIPGWGTAVAIGITALAAGLLIFMGVKMKDIVDQMADPRFKTVNQGINIGGKYASVGVLVGLSGLLVAAGWTNMWQNAWNNIESFINGFKNARTAGDSVGKAFKAGKEAATASSESAEGFKLKDFLQIRKIIRKIFPYE